MGVDGTHNEGGPGSCSVFLGTVVALSLAIGLGLSAEVSPRDPLARAAGPAAPPPPAASTPGAPAPPARIRPVLRRSVSWTRPLQLTVLHTNDIRGQAMPLRDGDETSGLLALGQTIRRERLKAEAAGDAVLLLDAGDWFQGTPEGRLTEGAIVLDWMNMLGYDAATLGDRDVADGVEPARTLAQRATFPVLGANLLDPATGRIPGWLGRTEGEDDELGGAVAMFTVQRPHAEAKVAVVGLASDLDTADLRFSAEAATLRRVLERLPRTDLVILLSHAGLETDVAIAREFAGRIDLVVGAHSRDALEDGHRVGDVLVVQAGARTSSLGRVRLTLSPPEASGPRAGRPSVSARADAVRPHTDPDLRGLLSGHLRRVEELVGLPAGGLDDAARPIGELASPLLGGGEYESSALGNLLADLIRAHAQTDVAFQNKSGIRGDLDAGPVTWRDVYQVAPANESVVRMLMRGEDLRDLLEAMVADPRTLLEVSGLELVCDPGQPKGQRVSEARIGGELLDPRRLYAVATNTYLANGGDGHEAFARGTHIEDTEKLLRDLLLDHFEGNAPFDPGITEQRIRLAQ